MLLALLAAAPAVFGSLPARAGPWLPRPGDFFQEFRGGFDGQNSFYDGSGEKRRLTLGTVVEKQSITSVTELGWKRRVSVAFSVPVDSRTFHFRDLRLSRSQTGISDLFFGFRFKLKDGASAVSIEADWTGPAGYDRHAPVPLGNGAQHVGGTLNLGVPLVSRGFAEASGTYWHVFGLPADEIRSSADVAFWLTGLLLVAGHYHALVSSGTQEADQFSRQSAGPDLTYRVDDRMDVFAGSDYTFAGRNASRLTQYYVGIAVKQTHLNRLQGYLGGTRRP